MRWKALRVWAADKRDDTSNQMGIRDSAGFLCHLFDTIERAEAQNLKDALAMRALQVIESILIREGLDEPSPARRLLKHGKVSKA